MLSALVLLMLAGEPRLAVLPNIPFIARPGLEQGNRRARRRDAKLARA